MTGCTPDHEIYPQTEPFESAEQSKSMKQMNQMASPDDIDITALWQAVMARKKSLLLSALGVGALTFIALSLVTPQYTATTRIIIENDEGKYINTNASNPNANHNASLVDKEAVISQVHVLRSQDLASDVIKNLRLERVPEFNDALQTGGFLASLLGGSDVSEEERVLMAFEKRLTVYPIKESRIIAIDMTSEDPKLAAQAVNALAKGYIDWQRGRQVNQTKDESESLGRQIDELKAEVAKADFKLEKFRSETGLYSGQNNVTLNAQQLSEVNSQLSLAKAQKSEAEARAKQIREMLKSGTVDSAPDVLRSQLIQRLYEQRVTVQRQISELSATLLRGHPRMKQLNAELYGISRQIRHEVRKIVRGLENEARIAGAREKSLRESLDQVRQQAAKSGSDQVRLSFLEREAESKRTLYKAVLAKFDEAKSATASSAIPVNARIVEKARASSIPSFPQKLPMTIFAMAATLLLGLAYLVTRALLEAARPEFTPGPASGGTPYGRGGGRRSAGNPGLAYGAAAAGTQTRARTGNIIDADATRTTTSTCSDVVKLLIQRGYAKPGFRTMVTTATNGKSALSVASDIARGLSFDGQRTVVISGERNSQFAPHLPDAAGGLTDVINGRIAFGDAVRHDKASGVDMVDVGLAAFDWTDMRNTEVVNRVLDNLDDSYDQVLIAADPGSATAIFSLIEGRFDQGVVAGSVANGQTSSTDFLGFNIPEFHVVTLAEDGRSAASPIRAQFSTTTPSPAAT